MAAPVFETNQLESNRLICNDSASRSHAGGRGVIVGGTMFFTTLSRQKRWSLFVSAAVFCAVLCSCAGKQQQPGAVAPLAAGEAKPEQSWSPTPVPARPPIPGAASLNRFTVPSRVRQAHPVYRRAGPPVSASMPAFEIPVEGAGERDLRGRWAAVPDGAGVVDPGPVSPARADLATPEKAAGSDPQPLAWTGTEVGASFLSTNFDDNGAYTGGYRFIPPDSHAAAGPNHVVDVVNVTITFHQKNGTIDMQDSLANFFASLSPLTFTFDPKVLYDQYAGRWVVLTMEQTQVSSGDPADTSRMFVAVSDDSDPNGTWYVSQFSTVVNTGEDNWADYPGFAVDDKAVYITTNLFGFSSGSYNGARVWILDKGLGSGGFYDNGPLSVTVADPYASAGIATTTQPSHMYGTVPAGMGVFLVSFSGISSGSNELAQVVRLDDPLGTPTFTQTYVSLGDIDSLSGSLPDMPQSGTTTLIESNDRRALDAVWRNNALWLTTTINPNTGADSGQATAMWIKIDTSNLGSLSLADSGTIGGEDIATGAYTTFPSIAVNASEDVVVGFSASAPSIYAGAYFVDRQASDAPGYTGSAVTVKAGVDWYKRTFGGARNRWGDYSAAVVDPADECFWVFNEWADTQGTLISGEQGRWGTAYVKTCPVTTPVTCNNSYTISAGTWTRFALPCSVAPANTVEDIFSGLNPAEYGATWVVYGRDSATPAYFQLALTDPMTEGNGYWVYSDTATTVNIDGSPAAVNDIDLVGVASTGRDNYVGHNQNVSVDWNQVLVVDGSNVLGIADFDKKRGPNYDCDPPVKSSCIMSRKMQKWTGSAYQVYDGDPSTGTAGTLDPFDGFWVQAFKPGIKLRIPLGTAAPVVAASTTSTQSSDTAAQGKKKPGKNKNGAWYIRLIASAGDMKDPGNVLGQVSSAKEGNDAHDLEEPPPFGSHYLSVLFTNPLFGPVDWGFTTDFRAPTRQPSGVWPFVVRADASVTEATLRWEGEDYLFKNAWLVDEESGAMLPVKAGESYTFAIEGGVHHFRFEVGNG